MNNEMEMFRKWGEETLASMQGTPWAHGKLQKGSYAYFLDAGFGITVYPFHNGPSIPDWKPTTIADVFWCNHMIIENLDLRNPQTWFQRWLVRRISRYA